MRKLVSLCRRYNRSGQSRIVVFRVPKRQYGYKYLVRYSPSGSWDNDSQYRFQSLDECIEFVQSFFR